MTKVQSLYIHFPFCKSFCNYCDFYKIPLSFNHHRSIFSEFHQYLNNSFLKVMDSQALSADFGGIEINNLQTLYIGGGSPSLWGSSGAEFIKKFLTKNQITFDKDYEFTLEVSPSINSNSTLYGTLDGSLDGCLDCWRDVGVNRISVGIQTINSEVFSLLDRKHTIEDTFILLDYLRNNNWNYSLDFMIGLPSYNNKDRDIVCELSTVNSYNPSHYSVYIFSPKDKEYPLHLREKIPDEDAVCEEYLMAASYLKSEGFIHYEVSNFAKINKESKHNQRYWKNNESYLALGPSSCGFLTDGRGTKGVRYSFAHDLLNINFDIDLLGKKELLLEKIYLSLRTNRGIDALAVMPIANKEEQINLEKNFELWKNNGLLESEFPQIKLSAKGFLLLDSIMDDLFKCLQSL
ncbi:MAG: radical SAM protein [Oligoflexia bacterium]|nr:radical SAM protein [Oligoflexia bacterium]